MKNKEKNFKLTTLGFTLIELLAVIVILAIIALIATPIVLDIIEDTKKSAQLRSAENYIKAAEMAVAKEMMYNAAFKANVCDITSEGDLNCNGTSVEVAVSGEKPDGGELTFGSGSVTEVTLEYKDDTIIRDGGELKFDDEEKLDENATSASCFGVEPVYEYEIGPNCDAYFQELTDESETTCNGLVNEFGDLLIILKEYKFGGSIENISLEQMEEAGAITNLKDTNTVSITNYTCGGLEGNENVIRDVVIPSKINGKKVTKIDYRAFYPYDRNDELIETKLINSVEIPTGVTTIGYSTFAVNQLVSVTMPNSVTNIFNGAFEENNLKSVEIPDSVITIGECSFRKNQLETVEIPDSVTSIGMGAFMYNKLKTVRIGTGITFIGTNAFSGGSATMDTGNSYGSNQLTSVIINKNKPADNGVSIGIRYGTFGWAEGYSDENITWQS